jgi:hypothetical protein
MYTAHPSAALRSLFALRPFQGVAPTEATFVFVGLDANYEADLEHKPIFSKVREYHEDGVAFWRRNRVHHPFLLPEYSGDGQFYHRSFARIGFGPEHAHRVSFVELLHVPTVGRNKLAPTDFSAPHLSMLNDALLHGRAKHIFISSGVSRLMHATKAFGWLPKAPGDYLGPLGVLYRHGTKVVYSHLHFSVYGKFEERKVNEAAAIRELAANDD